MEASSFICMRLATWPTVRMRVWMGTFAFFVHPPSVCFSFRDFFLPIWPVSSIGRSDWIGSTNSTNLKRGGKRRTEEKRSRWKEQSRTQRYFYRPTIENMRNHHPPESEGINRNMMNRGEGKRWRWIPRRGREHQIKQRRHRRHRRHHFPFDFFPHSRPLFYWRF